MPKVEQLKIKPYARLLTMLGEQLIKNERIALIELIKNAYDADAKWVKISFEGFGEAYQILEDSKIIIEDSGIGMNEEIIKNHWLNPATPEKKIRKKIKSTTESGRVIQGEKGIGRFAIFKLGNKIEVVTRGKGELIEHVVQYDFTNFDEDFIEQGGSGRGLFLDELSVGYFSRAPQSIIQGEIPLKVGVLDRPPHGTCIEVSALKGNWSEKHVKAVYEDIARLQSIFDEVPDAGFQAIIFKDGEKQDFEEDYRGKLQFLLNDRAVLKVENGAFDANALAFTFELNGTPIKLGLNESTITGLNVFRERFGNAGKKLSERNLECGPFKFAFYVFDLGHKAPIANKLDPSDKKILKAHRIYLYRDGIRVYPYGEPDDDWLRIDVMRGTISAGSFLSNDQVVGYINISQDKNPKLRDKTNREGLIEEGEATQDFITLIQSLLSYLRHGPYTIYQIGLENQKSQDIFRTEQIQKNFDELKVLVANNKPAKDLIERAEKDYKTEREYLTRRAEMTEDLAGVGLSVETASHDIMSIMGRLFGNLDGLIKELTSARNLVKEYVIKELEAIRGGLSFVKDQLEDIQVLFRSSKRRRKSIRVREVVEKVEKIYRQLLKKERITLDITDVGSPLVAKTTDAVLLQLLLNLIDNAAYWLTQIDKPDKTIKITLDGNKGQMIVSDNGPGIKKEDRPYIFEPFFSGKGEDGRGLGLYIARQLLERNEYSIELSELKSEKLLSGANFVINFVSEES